MSAERIGMGDAREIIWLKFSGTGALLGPRTPRQGVHRPTKANRGRSSLSANHVDVLGGFVSAYSQNDVAATTQR
jgi:hypothetical protein